MHLNRGPNNQQSFQSMKNWFRRTSLTHVRRQHFELVVDCLIRELPEAVPARSGAAVTDAFLGRAARFTLQAHQ